jgi:hypothetical protein
MKTNNNIAFDLQFQKYIQGYITEARWLNNKYQPTLEEYIRSTTESGGYKVMLITCYIDMGEIVTENMLKWIANDPKICNAAMGMARIMDDITSNEVYIYNSKKYYLQLY